jgi:hypothetical protein
MGGNDEKYAGHCESCTGDDPSNPLQPQGWDFRRNEPDSRDQDEQKPEFGELYPGCGRECVRGCPA